MRAILPIHQDFIIDEDWQAAVNFCHLGNHELAYLVLKHIDDEGNFYADVHDHADSVFNTLYSHKEDGLQAYYDDKFEKLYDSAYYQLGLSMFYFKHRAMYVNLIGDYMYERLKDGFIYRKPTKMIDHHSAALMVEFS